MNYSTLLSKFSSNLLPKGLFFFLIAVVQFDVFAQTNIYHPYPTDSAIFYTEDRLSSTSTFHTTWWIGDTIINGLHYVKEYEQYNTVFGAIYKRGIRQDIANEQIYSIVNGVETNISVSRFLHIGDTLTSDYVIQAIDSVLVGGDYYLRYKSYRPSSPCGSLQYIVGVGISYRSNFCTSQSNTLSCFRVGNKLMYSVGACFTESLTLSKDSLSALPQSKTDAFNISSNQYWSASSNQPWLTLSRYSGIGNAQIIASIDSNSGFKREAIISVTTGVLTKNIIISQSGVDTMLMINKDSLNFTSLAATDSILLVSNSNWLASCNEPWATIFPASGSGNATCQIAVAQNSGQARQAIITIICGPIIKTVDIFQQNNVTGVGDIYSHLGDVFIYPNPVKDLFTLSLSLTRTEKVTVLLSDMYGREMKRLMAQDINPGDHKEQMDLSGVVPGYYFLNITVGNYSVTKKVIVVN